MVPRSLLTFIFLCCWLTGSGQSSLSLSYPTTASQDELMIMVLMDIAHLNAQLQGALSGKKAVLTEHIVTGPEVVTNEMAIYSPMKSDTVIIKAMASRVSDETFKLYIVIEDTYYNLREMEMPYEYHMLLETELETPADRDIPVFAYTPGIKTTREYYGEEHEVVDYCGLRDSLVHPSQWYERFGITNYIYYTVSFD